MIRARPFWLPPVAAALVAAACGDPCADLVARTCGEIGEGAPLCQRLERVAERPSVGDRQAWSGM